VLWPRLIESDRLRTIELGRIGDARGVAVGVYCPPYAVLAMSIL